MISVVDSALEDPQYRVDPVENSITAPATAALLKRAPGGNLNDNGPLSGIANYRGMFGPRVSTKVDGMHISPGGPNWMDPPLSYAARPRLEDLKLYRGIAPVSAGNETIGGAVTATTRSSRFSDTDAFRFHGNLDLGGQTANDGYGLGALLAGSNDRHRLHVSASLEKGNDSRFPDGTITPTEYDRSTYGIGYGFRAGEHEFGLDYLRNETGDTGTPALPMDIAYVDSNLFRGEYQGAWNENPIGGRVYYTEVDHKMTNFHLRQPPPNPQFWRFALTDERGGGYDLNTSFSLGTGRLAVGLDGNLSEHNADVFNPNNAMFFVNNFNDATRDVYGLFGEWQAELGGPWSTELGARYTRVNMDSGPVDASGAKMNPMIRELRDRFNNSNRSQDDNNLDLVAKVLYEVQPDLIVDLGVARKTRSPTYQERYLWLPLQSTSGLADGNNYVGDVNLEPEVAYEVELGLDWHSARGYATPRVFYRRVDDYIQGVPSTDPVVIAVSNMTAMMMGMMPQPPLQFSNVDAELYGIDADWGVTLTDRWRLDGILSYVRGKRRDISDNLYRIPPLNGTAALTYQRPNWSVTAEGVFYASQDEVSKTNRETETSGYGLLNLFGQYRFQKDMALTIGIANVFNRSYQDHLSGVNRVQNSDVPVGERLPGTERNLYASFNYSW
ncbi:MAG: TonB-dependent receptor [Pseudomonadota bacterium]|nr:TonB-dependent receptor [Pseudomonadota bacterium]